REAARQREEAARRTEAERATQDRQTLARHQEQDEACARDEHQLVRLRGSANMGWAREDLKRLEESTTCERTRAEVAALLSQPPTPSGRRPRRITRRRPTRPSWCSRRRASCAASAASPAAPTASPARPPAKPCSAT